MTGLKSKHSLRSRSIVHMGCALRQILQRHLGHLGVSSATAIFGVAVLSIAGVTTASNPPSSQVVRSAPGIPVTAPGESATLLPNGTWLLVGGESGGQVSGAAYIENPATGTEVELPSALNVPRAWQTATLLPDGQVFIFGGTNADNQTVSQAELYDPVDQSFTLAPATGLAPRSHATANVLTNGEVLFAGGAEGAPAELWDPATNTVTPTANNMVVAREDATAVLLPTGVVLISGGTDSASDPVATNELFSPSLDEFSPASSVSLPASPGAPPSIEESVPTNNANGTAISAPIAVRFSDDLSVISLNNATVTLTGPAGPVAANVVPTAQGLLLFVTPGEPLLPSSAYTLTIQGATDTSGQALPAATLRFTTGTLDAASGTGTAGSGAGNISVTKTPSSSASGTAQTSMTSTGSVTPSSTANQTPASKGQAQTPTPAASLPKSQVKPQAMSTGTTVVGTIPGAFSVSPTGAAGYTIPIELPRGSGGLTPSLALVYNSQSGSGAAGWGWTFSGLSAITRCNQTIDDDGNAQAVQLQSTDAYCLNGERLLVTNGGAEGANGTLYDTELRSYQRITSITASGVTGGPSYWTVEAKDGTTFEYGNTADSKIYATNPGGGAETAVRVWTLDKVTDANGNYYTVTYQNNDATTGDYWPTDIEYTGNTHASNALLHDVHFTWAPRTAAAVQARFLAGTLVTQTEVLTTVSVEYNGSTTIAYDLSYNGQAYNTTTLPAPTADNRYELTTVTECNANSQCFAPTTIQWQAGAVGWQAAQSTGITVPDIAHANAAHLMDVNGDGIEDLVYPGTTDWMVMFGLGGGGFGAPVDTGMAATNYQYALSAEFNGDGREDLMWPDTTDGYWHVLKATGNTSGSIFTDVKTSLSDTGTNTVSNEPIYEGNAMAADYQGDGLSDFVYSDGINIYDVPNTGGAFGSANPVGSEGVISIPEIGLKNNPEFVDAPLAFESSGRMGNLAMSVVTKQTCTDTCTTTTSYDWYALAATASGYSGVGAITGPVGDIVTPFPVSTLGDGLTDLLWAGPVTGSSSYEWNVNLSTGTGLLEIPTSITDPGDGYPLMADYYGDGRQEMIIYDTNGAWWMLRVNYDPSVPGFTVQATSTTDPFPSNYDPASVRVGNIEAQGASDLVYAAGAIGGAQTWWYQLHEAGADRVTNITDGLGNSFAPQYVSLSGSGAIYTKGSSAVYPEEDVEQPLQVVANYTASDGTGGTYTENYTYSGAQEELKGRGFLGFASRKVTDSRNGVTVEDDYNQNYPFVGNIATETITQSNGEVLSTTNNTYATTPATCTNGTACFPYLSTSTLTVNDPNTDKMVKTVATQNTFGDSYGNLTLHVVTTTDKTTNAVFTSNSTTTFADSAAAGDYCISLPTASTVTKTTTSPAGNLTRATNSPQDTSACRPASVTLDPGGSPTETTAYSYDNWGNAATVTVTGTLLPAARVTTITYDAYGEYPVQIQRSGSGITTEIAHEIWNAALGFETSATDPNGQETQWGPDGFGRKTSETLPTGLVLGWTYGACGSTLGNTVFGAPANCAFAVGETSNAQSEPVGATLYDAKGRPIEAEKWLPGQATSIVQTTYDALGRATIVTEPYLAGATTTFATHTNYDVLNRPVGITSPANASNGSGDTTTIAYNGFTTTVTKSAPSGANSGIVSETTTTVTDALGELASKTDGSESAQTLYTYDPFGDLVSTQDADGHVTTMSYDALGHKQSMTDPDMGSWTYNNVDALGEVLLQTDADGNTITQTYDALGRRTSRVEKTPSGSVTANDTWTWDTATNGVGLLATESDSVSGFTKAYTYNTLSQPVDVNTTINGTGYQVSTSYDGFGRVASITYPVSAAPSNPTASASASPSTAVIGNNLTLSGAGSTDPDGLPLTYQWTETAGPGSPAAQATIGNSAGETTTVSASTVGTYTFALVVSDQNGSSDPTQVSVVFTPVGASTPTISGSNPNTTGSYTVSWSTVQGAQSYNLYQSSDGTNYTTAYSGSGTSQSFSSQPDGTYYYEVEGCASGACGPRSSAASVQVTLPPGTPATPSGSASTSGTISITWSAPGGTWTTGELEESTDESTWNEETSWTSSSPATSWAGSGFGDGTYYFRTIYCDGSACSTSGTASASVLLPPGVPGTPSASPNPSTSGGYTLAWGSVSTATSYDIYLSVNGGSYGELTSTTSTSYSASEGDGSYAYEVAACNASGCSSPSAAVTESVTLAPGTPSTPAASPDPSTNGSFIVTWGAPSSTWTSIEFQESADDSSWTTEATGGTSWSASGFGNGTYYFRTIYCDGSACSVSGTGTESVTLPPATPGGVSVSPNPSTNGSYTISWSGVAAPVSEYKIYSGGSLVTSTTGTSTSFGNIGDGSYSYYVIACYGTACSGASSTVTETVLHVPGAPSSINLSPYPSVYTFTAYMLSWGSASGTVTSYVVNGATAYPFSASTFSTSFMSATPGSFSYYVQACNASGCGPQTATITETVLQKPKCQAVGPGPSCKVVGQPGTDSTPTSKGTSAPAASSGGAGLTDVRAGSDALSTLLAPTALVMAGPLPIPAAALTPVPAPQEQTLADNQSPQIGSPDQPVTRVALTDAARPVITTQTPGGTLLAGVRPEPVTGQLVQPTEAQMQAIANARERALLPRLLPEAPAQDVAAWNQHEAQWGKAHPNGPDFAPPEYIAYANARVEPAVSTPYRFEVTYNYDPASGALTSVENAQTGFIYWQAGNSGATDAFGHLLNWTDGNNVGTVMTYDAATGAPTGISAGVSGGSGVQLLTYSWDGYGNLMSRQDGNQNLSETFGYDDLNRLTSSTVTNPAGNGPALGFGYDLAGNIQTKTVSGVTSTYSYDPNHPYAVNSVTNVNGGTYSASYDADGNMVTRNGEAIQWTPSNLPSSIAGALGTSTFNYGPDGARYFQSATLNSVTTDTTYVNGVFEVVHNESTGVIEYRHNIVADGQVIAVHTITATGVTSTDYLHYDHLGSVNAITDATGAVIQQMSFDAFGQRRIATNWDYGVSQATLATLKDDTDRGYTGQEQLDNLSLVDLNGRVYDPTVGRFISADPVMGGNRYTYAGNNPLEFTDPTGFCFLHCFWQPKQAANLVGDAAGDIVQGAGHVLDEVGNHWQAAAAIALAAYTGGASLAWLGGSASLWASVGAGAVAGGTFGGTFVALEGGDANQILQATFKGGTTGAVGGGLFFGAGAVANFAGNSVGGRIVGGLASGVAGGLSGVASGGNFNKGFELGVFAFAAQSVYQHYANGNQASISTKSNGAVYKMNGTVSDNQPYNNNFGNANLTSDPLLIGTPVSAPQGWDYEGSIFSNVMGKVPFMAPTSLAHDIMEDVMYGSAEAPSLVNVALMAPAFVMSVPSVIDSGLGAGLMSSIVRSNTGGGG